MTMQNGSRAADPARGAAVLAADRAHVFHSWSAQAGLKLLAIARAEGCCVWDYDGRRYLDFASQLVNVNIGHQHPRVTAAIAEQARLLCTVAPQHASEARGELARRIAGLAPDGMSKVFFTNGGADANENAIRMARLHTGRDKVLSTYRSYHGNTGAAITSTGDPRRWPNEFATGHVHFFGPYPYRSPFWSSDEAQERDRALAHLEQVIAFEGPATIAAVLLETIPGTAGVPGRGQGTVRPARDRADPRRGDGRVRPGRAMVRVRALRRAARPDHLRQGGELWVRSARRRGDLRRDSGDVRRPGLPRRAHLLRSPAGLRRRRGGDRRDARRGDHRERRPDRDRGPRPGPARAGQAASGDRGSPRGRRVLGAGPGLRSRDPRHAGTLRRLVAGNERADRRVHVTRADPADQLQPAARRAAVHDQRRRGQGGPGDPGRGTHGRGPLLRGDRVGRRYLAGYGLSRGAGPQRDPGALQLCT